MAKIDDAQEKVSGIECRLDNIRSRLNTFLEELGIAEKDEGSARETVKGAKDNVASRENDLTQAHLKKSGAVSDLEIDEKSLERASGVVASIKNTISRAESNLDALEQSIEGSSFLERMTSAFNFSQKKVDARQQGTHMEDLRQQLEEAEESERLAQEKKDQQVDEVSDAENAVTQAEARLEKAQKALADAETALTDAEETTRLAQERINQARAEIDAAEKELAQAQAELKAIEDKIFEEAWRHTPTAEVQALLNLQGANLVVDGHDGPATSRAVQAYADEHGLDPSIEALHTYFDTLLKTDHAFIKGTQFKALQAVESDSVRQVMSAQVLFNMHDIENGTNLDSKINVDGLKGNQTRFARANYMTISNERLEAEVPKAEADVPQKPSPTEISGAMNDAVSAKDLPVAGNGFAHGDLAKAFAVAANDPTTHTPAQTYGIGVLKFEGLG